MDMSTIKKDKVSSKLSVPRVGMKRELMSMLKTQKEMGYLPPIRRRATKLQDLMCCFIDDHDSDRASKRKRNCKAWGSQTAREVQDNAVPNTVLALPAVNAPKESKWVSNAAVEAETTVGEIDLGGSVSDYYDSHFDGRDIEILGLYSSMDFQKQMTVDKGCFLADFFDFRLDSNGEIAEEVPNDSIDGANVPQGTEMDVSMGLGFISVPKRLRDLLETGLLEGLRVRYVHGPKVYNGSKSELVGIIQGIQVLCSCVKCKGEVAVTPNEFELHAQSRNKRPAESIYLDNGKSLRQILNACKGADLDSLDAVIREAIRHPNETKSPSKDPLAPISSSKLEAPKSADGGSHVESETKHQVDKRTRFRRDNFKNRESNFYDQSLITCYQCEKEFSICNLKAVQSGEWFCSKQCNHIFSSLEYLVEEGDLKPFEAHLGFIKKKHEANGLHHYLNLDISCRFFKGKNASEDDRMCLSHAVGIFHEQFKPIIHTGGGRIDLIPHMVYGRNLVNQDFRNMLCALLIVDSSVVCAAIFRVFGEEVAELPLVATKSNCQKKGYFQALYYCIENILSSLNVKALVVPAAKRPSSCGLTSLGFRESIKER